MYKAEQILDAANKLKEKNIGVIAFWLPQSFDKENNWAIVIGYNGGFEKDENDPNYYRVCGKVAYQSKKSIMQCDYDVDWTMPYDEETSEVDDTDVSLDCLADAEWLLDQWERIRKEHGDVE